MKESFSIYFKDHTDRRISEIRERTKNFKAEKVKEKLRKKQEIQKRRRGKKRLNENIV